MSLKSGEAYICDVLRPPLAGMVALSLQFEPPRVMGFGPAPATRKVLANAGLSAFAP